MNAPRVSEHIAFVRADGIEAGHLLPIPRTRSALEVLIDNVQRVTKVLNAPLALEHIATLFQWPENEMSEAAFLTEVLERTDTLLLLDLANIYANCHNHGGDPEAFIDSLPLERLGYVHVAGGVLREDPYHDTHADPVTPQEQLQRLPDAGLIELTKFDLRQRWLNVRWIRLRETPRWMIGIHLPVVGEFWFSIPLMMRINQ